MRIGRHHRVALTCVVLCCASCRDSDDPGGKTAGADAAAQPPPHARDASAAFVECEPELLPPFGTNAAFACDRCGPHGSCPAPDPTQGDCQCREAYAGARCELCADGYVEHEGGCVDPCRAAGQPCSGICTGTAEAPSCECSIGYEGLECDLCSPGFEPDGRVFDALACAPTCDGRCAAEELCIAPSRDEQRCECMDGYERDAAGACTWQGFTADPDFAEGCAHWRLLRFVANETDTVIAELAPSELTLSVDHHCSGAGATAEIHLPTQRTLRGGALAITAMGTAGAILHVSFEENPFPFLLSAGGERLSGTGDWERHVVCLPLGEEGRNTVLTLAVGEGGACADPLDATITVQSLEVVTDDECES